MLLRFPGVYGPREDTWLLAGQIDDEDLGPQSRVLDVCTGTGALGIRASKAGAGHVTAVDISRRAVLNARINAVLAATRIRAIRGDLIADVQHERFDLVVSNPPYVPAPVDALPTSGPSRAWDAGRNGRALLDRICEDVPDLLAPDGVLLLAQSEMSDVEKTRNMLEEAGLRVSVPKTTCIPFGPVLGSRRELLEAQGFTSPGQDSETLYVLRAVK